MTDYAGRAVAIFGLATPNFWLGLMVMIYPAIWWGWAPPLTYVRFSEDPWGNLGILILPALILGTYLRYESPVDAAGAGRGGAGGGARGGGGPSGGAGAGPSAAGAPAPARRRPVARFLSPLLVQIRQRVARQPRPVGRV